MDSADKAYDCALRLLARRDHSVAELRRKLLQRGFPVEIIDGLTKRLLEIGYLDDRRYAERWVVAAIANSRGYGPRLRLELQQRGVPSELAGTVVAKLTEECDEAETLRHLAARKFPDFDPGAATDRERRRVFGFLQRRGFSGSAIAAYFRSTTKKS